MQGRTKGFRTVSGPNGTQEFETFTCAHCSHVVLVPHKAKPDDLGGICRPCMKMVCAKCCATGRCDPFEKKLKRMESRASFLQSVAGG